MTTKLIRIGRSRGVRLPKSVIERAGLGDQVEITVRGKFIIISKPPSDPRAGWHEAFAKAVAKHGHDVDQDWLNMPNDFDEKEWTW